MANETTQPDGLIRFAAMIAKADANALPKIGRIDQSDDCMGRWCDDPNVAVRGAANVLRITNCNARLRDRAVNELHEIAAAYRNASAGNVTASGGIRGAAPSPVIASKQVSREIGTQLPQGIGNGLQSRRLSECREPGSPSNAAFADSPSIGKPGSPSVPDTADPKVSSASRMKALNSVRGLPGYELPKPVEPIKGGLF